MAAWAAAEMTEKYRKRFSLVSLLVLFFSLDQIIVFQRLIDKNLIQGALGNWMLPCLAVACMAIPTLRTRQYCSDGPVAGFKSLPHLRLGTDPMARYPTSSPGHLLGLVSGLEACGSRVVRERETDLTKSCSISSEREWHVGVTET
jgi:hypothetical protein